MMNNENIVINNSNQPNKNRSIQNKEICVWDPLVRIFHWTLVISFFVAYFTEDEYLNLHTWAGYTIFTLISVRIFWGFVGTKHAKFSDFIYTPEEIFLFIKNTFSLKAQRYLGHNPAGGVMIFLLLISLFFTTASGVTLFAIEEGQGPLAWFIGNDWQNWEDLFEESHEFFANFTLLLVFIHVAGVIIESFIHKENLAKAMVTGKKRIEDEI